MHDGDAFPTAGVVQIVAMGCAASVHSPTKPPAVQHYNFVGPDFHSPAHLEVADRSDLRPSLQGSIQSLPSTSSSYGRKVNVMCNSRVIAYNAEEWEERFGDFLKNLEQMESPGEVGQ